MDRWEHPSEQACLAHVLAMWRLWFALVSLGCMCALFWAKLALYKLVWALLQA